VGKMLWLVPRYVEKQGTLMKLGSILKDPENLESSLNIDAIPAIRPSARRDATPHVRHYVHSELSDSNSMLAKAVPNLPLFSAGVSANGLWTHGAETTVQAMDVKAEVFIPDKEYMQEALKHKAIIDYAKKGLFATPLYIIVGVATASKLSVKEKQGSEHSAAASAHVTAPGGAGEGEVGFEHESKTAVESELEVGEACDFAYRVREFIYTRIRGLKDKGDRGEGTMFGQGGSGKATEAARKETEDFPQFLYFEKVDVDVPDLVVLAVPEEEPA